MIQKLSEFFKIEYGQREYHSKNHLVPKKEGVPLISSKGSNRGIYGYFDIEPKYSKVISVPNTGTICFAYYQDRKCCIDDNCLVLTPIKSMSRELMIYFSLLIRKEKYKYMYGRQVTPERLGETIIDIKIPNWIKKNNLDYSKIREKQLSKKFKINPDNWKEFKIDDLFFVYTGGDKPKKSEGELINSIENLTKNNGVNEKINYSGEKVFENFISIVSIGAGGKAFYQEEKGAIFTRVKALIPKFELNKYLGIFLITLLNLEQIKYSYGRVLDAERLKTTKIKLPVDSNGEPDWQFMEDYIKSLPYSKALEI